MMIKYPSLMDLEEKKLLMSHPELHLQMNSLKISERF